MMRKMVSDDKQIVLEMMRGFYDSPAVLHTSSDEVLEKDVDACIGDNPYIDGFIFEVDGETAGYTMLSKSFTTEYGGLCVWIEDLFIKKEYRGKRLASEFFEALPGLYPEAVRFKLEVEPENEHAVAVYDRCGYSYLPYNIMEKIIVDN